MPFSPVVVALPIADRRRSHDFYRAVLGVDAVGEPGDDGIAEPLQFPLNDGVRLMLIPSGGFGWVVGPRAVADAGTSECVVTLSADDEAGVDTLARRAQETGGAIVSEPGAQPWAYTATFTDPDGHLWSVMRG
jgi:predicted lactoylglutathione lyase